jgi:predicted small metal-binding protein
VQGYEFVCSNVYPDCEERIEGEDRDDVLSEVEAHMREHHGLIELPAEMTRWVLGSVRPDDG